MNAMTRIAIVGHTDLVRNGLERIISKNCEFEIAKSAAADEAALRPNHSLSPGPADADAGRLSFIADGIDPAETLNRAGGTEPEPSVIVFGPGDGSRADESSVAALSQLGRVLVVGDFVTAQKLSGAIRAGALGCVSAQVAEEELLLAIHTVARGGVHISPSLAALLHAELQELGRPPSPSRTMLAPREAETLGWVAIGLTHRQISRRMGLTESTVSTYVKRLRMKLNARNKADLTRMAIEFGLLRNEEKAVPSAGGNLVPCQRSPVAPGQPHAGQVPDPARAPIFGG